jgi:hypothetical protein
MHGCAKTSNGTKLYPIKNSSSKDLHGLELTGAKMTTKTTLIDLSLSAR